MRRAAFIGSKGIREAGGEQKIKRYEDQKAIGRAGVLAGSQRVRDDRSGFRLRAIRPAPLRGQQPRAGNNRLIFYSSDLLLVPRRRTRCAAA